MEQLTLWEIDTPEDPPAPAPDDGDDDTGDGA